MPIYEYECKKCQTRSEVYQKVSDKAPTKCQKCGGKLERVISAPAIQFKGSGWYVTDYAGKATSKEKSESESSTDKKTETKSTEISSAKKTNKPSPSKSGKD